MAIREAPRVGRRGAGDDGFLADGPNPVAARAACPRKRRRLVRARSRSSAIATNSSTGGESGLAARRARAIARRSEANRGDRDPDRAEARQPGPFIISVVSLCSEYL